MFARVLMGVSVALFSVAYAQPVIPSAQESKMMVRKTFSVPAAVAGERKMLTLPKFGKVVYYAKSVGYGRPLILVHSVNAAASAYEMRPLWNQFAGERPLYALEWPGFGSSDRPDVPYTKELMTSALLALVNKLNTEVDVVALSLGSEFAARAALKDQRIRSLALISPTGLGKPRGNSQRANVEQRSKQNYKTLRQFSDPLYALVRSRLSLEYFLDLSFRGPVPAGLIRYAEKTTAVPGAKYAPLYFLSGQLFTTDAYKDLYSKLTIPTLVLFDKDGFVNFSRLPQFVSRSGAQAVRINGTDGLPHFEKVGEVRQELELFWNKANQTNIQE